MTAPSVTTYPSDLLFPERGPHARVATTFPATIDPEDLLRAWLQDRFPAAVVQTETDESLADQAFTIQVSAGGGSALFKLERPRVVLDVFGQDRRTARANARAVDHAMRWELKGAWLGDDAAVVTGCTQISGPVLVPDPNTNLRHYAGTYSPTINPLPA